MATIHNVNLNITQDVPQFADLIFDVHFSDTEVNLGLDYYVYAALAERDGSRDPYIVWTNGLEALVQNTRDDDFISRFPTQKINPDGQQQKRVSMFLNLTQLAGSSVAAAKDGSFDLGGSSNPQEYFALIQVSSELAPSTVFSNEVLADVLFIPS